MVFPNIVFGNGSGKDERSAGVRIRTDDLAVFGNGL
jgi:hypothetical protein